MSRDERILQLGVLLALASVTACETVFGCDYYKVRMYGLEDTACDYKEYSLKRVALPGGAPIVLGVILFLIVCPAFFLGRYLCGCCGSSVAAPSGFCCPTENAISPATAYSEKHVRRAKCSTIPLMVAVAMAMGIVVYGDMKAKDTYSTAFDGAVEVPSRMRTMVETFTRCMKRPQGYEGNAGNWDNSSFVEAVDDLTSSMSDIRDTEDKYQYISDTRSYATLGVAAVPLVIAIIGVIFAYATVSGCAPMAVAALLFFWAFICFALLGVHVASFNMASDLCDEVDAELDKKGDNLVAAYLDYKCPGSDVESYIDDVHETQQQQDELTYEQCYNFVNGYCNKGQWWCDKAAINCSNIESFKKQLQDPTVVHVEDAYGCIGVDAANCSVALCKPACKNQGMSDTAADILLNTQDAVQIQHCLEAWGFDDCRAFVIAMAIEPQHSTCDTSRTALLVLVIGLVLLLTSLLAALYVFSHGSKTFIPNPVGSDYTTNALLANEDWKDDCIEQQMKVQKGDEDEPEMAL
eukprot:TRINITY_DN2690_c0_g1_i2.p1 TRINITY_DN2690_c0_g1~~TRINITY_DN2690_c0_g1_i2.p1  ORF type:complete len:546 (+),score=182.33 TRINITY_DN2690_c0_g1_i2:75-1640(+)